ncbi:S9 family peptidase [Nocardia callitridis]|uniref:Prolyl oligopeptidase family serine peptidase n=1 Tax=Nocardia callitridis TaxID=648753 RepID=A0ABP9K994_9NOCA
MSDALSYPRQSARTQRFLLGTPRGFTVAPDGERIVFLRARSGTDTTNLLWVRDIPTGADRLVADPDGLLNVDDENDSPQERARRERAREAGTGVVGYSTDDAVTTAAFVLSGRLFVADLRSGAVVEHEVRQPVFDPRISGDGRRVAYVSDRQVRVLELDGGTDRAVIGADDGEVRYGIAEFIAAEEMGRGRGFWWSPDGDRLLIAAVDESPVRRWWIAAPSDPERAPAEIAYPAAGTPNAEVTLLLVGLDGATTAVEWDRGAYPYLARVQWGAGNSPLLLVQARDQREQRYLTVHVETGVTEVIAEDVGEPWIELFGGVPTRTAEGRLVRIVDKGDARLLVSGPDELTDSSLRVRGVLDVDTDSVLFSAVDTEAATSTEIGEVHVYRADRSGVRRVSDRPGVHTAVRAGAITVLTSNSLATPRASVRVFDGDAVVGEIEARTATPALTARPRLLAVGEDRIPTAVLLPEGYTGDARLPVLLDPYGGPHGQRVVHDQRAYLEAQWFANQGLAVVIADGRGTANQSADGQKAVAGDLASTLDDQVAALAGLVEEFPLDVDRVAIRGWSFGGYLAALAVLRRPDVFHAAVAGAPVTDWQLYDTHYTERYLGHPEKNPEAYEQSSLVTAAGLSAAREPVRPLLLIHGLADDNVVVAHTLRLSTALLEAGRPHEVLPLSGVTHRTTQEEVAENLLLLQVEFIKRALSLD